VRSANGGRSELARESLETKLFQLAQDIEQCRDSVFREKSPVYESLNVTLNVPTLFRSVCGGAKSVEVFQDVGSVEKSPS
jgi:hypothetical protein